MVIEKGNIDDCKMYNLNLSSGWPYTMKTMKVSSKESKKLKENKDDCHIKCSDSCTEEDEDEISMISFNILSESYLTPKSHPNLPLSSREVVFNPLKRRELLLKTLDKLVYAHSNEIFDFVCLQEVDLYEEVIEPHLNILGYIGVNSKIKGKADCCAVFWNQKEYELVTSELIKFDDLVLDNEEFFNESKISGLEQSFLRKNTACCCVFNAINKGNTVIVVSAHLYWNPNYEYVKLAQAKYLLEKCHSLSVKYKEAPVFVCGDINSKPNSCVYKFFIDGLVDARRTSPWHYLLREEEEEEKEKLPHVRYIVDYTLNKLARYLRMLGIDTELETEEEERERTSGTRIILFEKCRKEKRTLITTSYKLILRKPCPPGTFLVNSSKDLKQTLCNLLFLHNVTLETCKFLTRCVVCNGSIKQVTCEEKRKQIFEKYKAPILSDLTVFQCSNCFQGFWWSDRPNSSASRVKNATAYLFKLAVQNGVPYQGDLNMFDFIKKDLKIKNKPMKKMKALQWITSENLSHPFNLKSAYTSNGQEILPFTNVTHEFVGEIFLSSKKRLNSKCTY